LKKLGHSDKAIVLVYTPSFREYNNKWEKIMELYPEADFAFYKDTGDVSKYLGVYIPILRPYCLMRYFQDHPEMISKAVFYCDCDVIFTDKFNIDKFKDDDINYLSDTNSYISASYFDSKTKDVLPEKLEEYKTLDVLAQVTSLIGIDRATCEKNNLHSGGAQYLLKNIDGQFWEKVLKDCLIIRMYLQNINRNFFASEDKGFQSWCADMWAVLWNGWLLGNETKVVSEMNFSWATDTKNRWEETTIFHNAGVTGTGKHFYKGIYQSQLPYNIDDTFDEQFCSKLYFNEIKETAAKSCLI